MKKNILRIIQSQIFSILILIFCEKGFNQTQSDFFTMVKGDSVFIFLIEPPKSYEHFFVYRKGPLPENNEFQLLNPDDPVAPVLDAEEARTIIDVEWNIITRALETEDPFEVLRKLRGSKFASGLLSLLSTNVAKITGRLFLDTTAQANRDYVYKIVIQNTSGKEIKTFEKRIKTTEIYPVSPTKLKAHPGDSKVKLIWDYPKWNQTFDDLGLYFDIYRKKSDGDFEKINQEYVIRDDAAPKEYMDLWLENEQEYYYYVVAVDPIKRESKPSEVVKVVPIDDTPPSIPTNLIVESGDGYIVLSWNVSLELDAIGYNVYRARGLDQKFEKINVKLVPLLTPYFIDSSVVGGVQYFYSVNAIDKSKNESQLSNAMSVIALDKTPPEPPKDLKYQIENRILKLSWKPSDSKDVMGYFIYVGESEGVQPKIVFDPLKATSYIDSGFNKTGYTPGKSYFVSVTAMDNSRNESEKVTLCIKIPDDEPPLPPEGLIANNVEGRYVELSCGMSPSLDVEFYKLYRETMDGKNSELITFTTTPLKYRDTAVVKGNQYIYYAIAFDSAKNRSMESRKDTVWFKDFSPPPSPRFIKANMTEQGVTLEWERVVDFDLVGYNIYRSELPTGIFQKLNDKPIKELKYIDKTGIKHHYYKVKSVDTSGNESLSNEAVHPN